MKLLLLRLFAALAIALCTFSAKADLFDYSYKFQDGNIVSGSLTGVVNGLYIDNISNVSASYNGVFFSGSPNLFHSAWDISTLSFSNTVPAVVSFNGSLNNFLFIDSNYPTEAGYHNYFFMTNNPDPISGFSQAFTWGAWGTPLAFQSSDASYSTYGCSYCSNPDTFSAARWSLTPVPEPETYAMMLAGLGLLGFMARRRKEQLAA